MTLHVRARGDTERLTREIRAMLATIGPGLAPVDMSTMEREIETSMWQERMLAAISRIFAALMAGIGLSGMIAFTLARRTREVGIRMAVGATPRNIARLFARQAGSAVVPGILGGSPVSYS